MPGERACPLCRAASAQLYGAVGERRFFDCAACGLVFQDRATLPSPTEEVSQYELHENDPADPRYRAFLSEVVEPLYARMKPGAEGLDFGCGPGPAIQPMMAERGLHVTNYDPFFAPAPAALERSYDFITCTETIEHFHKPAEAFSQLDRLLRPGGLLGVMTMFFQDPPDLSRWAYARDPTHVAFYRPATMSWIASHYGWRLETLSRRTAIFEKAG